MQSSFWQLSVSSQHMVKSLTVNSYMSLFNLKLCTHIWSTNINLDPPYIGLFGPSWTELSPYGWIAGRGVDWSSDTFFVTDGQKRDYLSRASQRAKGATKNKRRCNSVVQMSKMPLSSLIGHFRRCVEYAVLRPRMLPRQNLQFLDRIESLGLCLCLNFYKMPFICNRQSAAQFRQVCACRNCTSHETRLLNLNKK